MSARVMSDFVPVTDEDLARARRDPMFRQQLLAKNLDRLIAELNRLKSASTKIDATRARQIREGVQLAVKLAEILNKLTNQGPPPNDTRAA
jgi:hypothetical protein